MSSVNKSSFLPNIYTFYFRFLFIILAKTPITMLKTVIRGDNLVLFLILMKKLRAFIINYDIGYKVL